MAKGEKGPMDVLADHLEIVLDVWTNAEGSAKAKWTVLAERVPEIGQAMGFATAKQYAGILVALSERDLLHTATQITDTQKLHRITKERDKLALALDDATQAIHNLQAEVELYKATQNDATQKIHTLETDVERLNKELSTQEAIQAGATQLLHKSTATQEDTQSMAFPKKILGWAVQRSPDGYHRAHKRIGGRMKSVYLGKAFDLAQAEEKIRAAMAKILGQEGAT